MVVGACGSALVAMVARICAESPKYAAVEPLARRLVALADELRAELMDFKERDEAAYGAVVAARGDKDAMQRALRTAAHVPLEGARSALAVLRLCAEALELRNKNLVSDVGCAAEFAYAALAACAYNVRINHKFMKDAIVVSGQGAELERYDREAKALLGGVRRQVAATLSG